MVDRITPATTDDLRAAVRAATGAEDAYPVPTEPFSEWVIQGRFPAGRPAWETAGARIVDDVAPFERRKLALLNGSHSLLAYAGTILGHETVADAIADARCLAWVEQWWDEACLHIPPPSGEVVRYRGVRLAEAAPPHRAHPARGGGGRQAGAPRVLAAWVLHLRGHGAPVTDVRAVEVRALVGGTLEDAVSGVLAFLDPGLATDGRVHDAVLARARDLTDLEG